MLFNSYQAQFNHFKIIQKNMRFVKTQRLAIMCCVHLILFRFFIKKNSLVKMGRKTKYGAQDKLSSRGAEVQIKSSMSYSDTSNETENISDITLALCKKSLHLKEEMFLLQQSEWEVTYKSLWTLFQSSVNKKYMVFDCYLFISMVSEIKALKVKCFLKS